MNSTMKKPMYINGELIAGGLKVNVVSPATEHIIGAAVSAKRDDALAALEAADRAFDDWARRPVNERIKWMHRLREQVIEQEEHLRRCVHIETGKTWGQTAEDFQFLVDSLQFYAEEITRLPAETIIDREGTHTHLIDNEPVGVVTAFLAWNFPLLNLAFKIGPALAAGCPIVIKPSFKTPLATYAVGELCHKIGLPPGVVNILTGDDEEIGDALSSSTIPAMLTLIGSTATGQRIQANGATSIKRHSMELGGNAPAVVFDDADLDTAADIISAVKFGNAGQICVTPNRVLVHENVKDALLERLVERASAVRVGHSRDDEFDMGPVIDRAAHERITTCIKEAVDMGARVATGGGRPEGLQSGFYIAPTVLDGVTPAMRAYREEIFGPVVSLTTFSDDDQALKQANDTDAGLTAYIFSRNAEKTERIARRLRFGEIHINGVKHAIFLPHGGFKQSGIGCDCSHLALRDYLVPKRITRTLSV